MKHKYPIELEFCQSWYSLCYRLPVVGLLSALKTRSTGICSASPISKARDSGRQLPIPPSHFSIGSIHNILFKKVMGEDQETVLKSFKLDTEIFSRSEQKNNIEKQGVGSGNDCLKAKVCCHTMLCILDVGTGTVIMFSPFLCIVRLRPRLLYSSLKI